MRRSEDPAVARDFADFCGDHTLVFSQEDEERAEALVVFLSEERAPLEFVLTEIFSGDIDQLARSACFAFSCGALTREQVSTLLEWREIKSTAEAVKQVFLLDASGNFTEEAKRMVRQFFSLAGSEEFLQELRKKPRSEQCIFEVTIKQADQANPAIRNLFNILQNVYVVKMHSSGIQRYDFEEAEVPQNPLSLIFFGAGSRDAQVKAYYGEHAKKLYPRLGVFSKEDIERSVRAGGRYSAVSYPGIAAAASFHGIPANTLYLTLHDEAHRSITSTIPNNLFHASLYALDVVRAALGANPRLHWSKEIWEHIDMDLDVFFRITEERRNTTDPHEINEDFLDVLSARVASESGRRPGGLFTDSARVDTTWLLLIDMVCNPGPWLTFGIDPRYFPTDSIYKTLYDFIAANRSLIEMTPAIPPAHQVAVLKSQYFGLILDPSKTILFEKGKDNFLQVTVDGAPIGMSKALILKFLTEGINSEDKDFLSALISYMQSTPKDFCELVPSDDLYALIRAMPERQNDLLQLFVLSLPSKPITEDERGPYAAAIDRVRSNIYYCLELSPDGTQDILNAIDLRVLIDTCPDLVRILFCKTLSESQRTDILDGFDFTKINNAFRLRNLLELKTLAESQRAMILDRIDLTSDPITRRDGIGIDMLLNACESPAERSAVLAKIDFSRVIGDVTGFQSFRNQCRLTDEECRLIAQQHHNKSGLGAGSAFFTAQSSSPNDSTPAKKDSKQPPTPTQ